MNQCNTCPKSFTSAYLLERHKLNCGINPDESSTSDHEFFLHSKLDVFAIKEELYDSKVALGYAIKCVSNYSADRKYEFLHDADIFPQSAKLYPITRNYDSKNFPIVIQISKNKCTNDDGTKLRGICDNIVTNMAIKAQNMIMNKYIDKTSYVGEDNDYWKDELVAQEPSDNINALIMKFRSVKPTKEHLMNICRPNGEDEKN